MRIEKRQVGSSEELTGLVKEALEGEIRGFEVLEGIAISSDEIEIGMLAGDAEGRVLVVAAKEKSGDSLILSFGSHVEWLRQNKERLTREHTRFNWDQEPGIILMAENFSPRVLTLTSLLGVSPKQAYTMKCLGIGTEKGLYIETVGLPEVSFGEEAPVAGDNLLSRTITNLVATGDGLEVSASFGYRGKSLDWVPVANLRSHRGTIWIESGPGKWTTKRLDNERALGAVLDYVRRSYEEAFRAKGRAKEANDTELSDAEKKSLRWE